MTPAIDLMDETFVVSGRAELAAHFAELRVWHEWWPGLRLMVHQDRGLDGIRWTVAGELAGSAEIWLEEWYDGVIVHWYLRAEPAGTSRAAARAASARRSARIRRRYTISFKSRIHQLKDRLEHGRPAGVPREPAAG